MKFKDKAKMSIEDWRFYENDDDYEFAYGTVDFLSTRPNSHKYVYTEDVIKEFAPTVVNKWVTAEYDRFTNDATTHTNEQKIVGRVPNQEIKYRYDDEGYLVASVDVIISKLYATDIYNLFKTHNFRNVSVEHLVGFTPETMELRDGYDEKKITGFNITSITVLGLHYSPSIPNANIKLTQMSTDTLEKAEKEYCKYSVSKMAQHSIDTSKESIDTGDWDGEKAKRDLINDDNFLNIASKVCMRLEDGWKEKQTTKLDYPVMNLKNNKWVYNRKGLASALSYAKQQNETAIVSKIEEIYRKLGLDQEEKMNAILEKLEQIDNKLNSDKEETMAEEIKETVEETSEATMECGTDSEKPEEMACEKDMSENTQTEEQEMSQEDFEQETEVEAEKMAKLETELADAKVKISEYESKIAELEAFKTDVENQKMNNIVSETLSKVKENVTEDEYKTIVENSKECTFESVGAWKNATLAVAFESKATKKVLETSEFVDMGKPEEQKVKYESVYDKY